MYISHSGSGSKRISSSNNEIVSASTMNIPNNDTALIGLRPLWQWRIPTRKTYFKVQWNFLRNMQSWTIDFTWYFFLFWLFWYTYHTLLGLGHHGVKRQNQEAWLKIRQVKNHRQIDRQEQDLQMPISCSYYQPFALCIASEKGRLWGVLTCQHAQQTHTWTFPFPESSSQRTSLLTCQSNLTAKEISFKGSKFCIQP